MIDLKAIVEQEMIKTRDIIRGFPWEDRAAYGSWLAQTYHMVSHSTRLVALAAAHADFQHNPLHARFVDHAREERGHELVAVSDLREMGLRIDDHACLPVASALVQIQYYWIQHRGSASLFGYILSLECMSRDFGPHVLQRVQDAHGPRASKFVKLHAEDDIEHTEKAFEQLNAMPSPERSLIAENLGISASLYRDLLAEIPMHARGASRSAA